MQRGPGCFEGAGRCAARSRPRPAPLLEGESQILAKTERYALSKAALSGGIWGRQASRHVRAIDPFAKGLVGAVPILVARVRTMHIARFCPRFGKELPSKAAVARRKPLALAFSRSACRVELKARSYVLVVARPTLRSRLFRACARMAELENRPPCFRRAARCATSARGRTQICCLFCCPPGTRFCCPLLQNESRPGKFIAWPAVFLVPPDGFEPSTPALGERCSVP